MNLLLFPLPWGEGGPLSGVSISRSGPGEGVAQNAYYVTMPRFPYFSFVHCLLPSAYDFLGGDK